jgi:hypothetical protein
MTTQDRLRIVAFAAASGCWAILALAQEPAVETPMTPTIVNDDIPPGWIPPGWKIIEGDIQVPEIFFAPDGTWEDSLWPGKTVPFAFGPGIPQANQDVALQAIADWEAVTDVDFVPYTNQPNWVRIQQGTTSNNSAVGMSGGMQVINIVNWNLRTLRHELGHALGFWHEQSRLDRDAYITVNYANICQDCCGGNPCDYNFDKRPAGGGEYGPYDFDSIMHYSQWAFSICSQTPGCETIVCKPPYQSYQSVIGTTNDLSFWDARVMSFLYPEDHWRFLDDSAGTPNPGSFFLPYKTLTQAITGTPNGGVLWIQPGSYASGGTLSKPMTIRAPLGMVIIGE